MTTAKELLLAAGWSVDDGMLYASFTRKGKELVQIYYSVIFPDDNLTDMLIRELSEEQAKNYIHFLCLAAGRWATVVVTKATPEQKAAALMETYKERE